MASRWARVARGSLVASTAVFVAAFSHVVAGGSGPGGAGLALACAFAVLISIAVVGKRMTAVRTAVAVGASQFFFHLVFTLGSGSGVTLSQHGHHGAVTMTVGAGASGAMHHSSGSMWFAHAIAAVVTVVYLQRVERSVWRVISSAAQGLVVRLLGRSGVVVLLPDGSAAERVHDSAGSLVRDDLSVALSVLRHRGPPAFVL